MKKRIEKEIKKWERRTKRFKKRLKWYGDRLTLLRMIVFYKIQDFLEEHELFGLLIVGAVIVHSMAVMALALWCEFCYVETDMTWFVTNLVIISVSALSYSWYSASYEVAEKKGLSRRSAEIAQYLD